MSGSPRDRLSETCVSVNVLAIVMTLLGSVASAPAQNFGMGEGTTFFTIDWERGQHRGKPSVRGYIANHWGLAATDLRLKVEGLDVAGPVTSTTIDRIPGDVAPASRAYFDVLAPPAPSYRLSVMTYTWSTVEVAGVGVAAAGAGGCNVLG